MKDIFGRNPHLTLLALSATMALLVSCSSMRKEGEIANARIEILKSARTLNLYDGDSIIRTYRIGLGSRPVGDKEAEGDGKTPEGQYYVFVKNPRSKFFLSLGVSYPSKKDAERGLRSGAITESEAREIAESIERKAMPPQKTALGGEIYIHGRGAASDWTEGCIALDDADMKELFAAVPKGTVVSIKP